MQVAIVGAGIGGLAAARLLAPSLNVTLYERASAPGGRARSQVEAGAVLNLGPHALYEAGAAGRVLKRLGVIPAGGVPPFGGLALRGGRLHELPAGPLSVLRTGALTAMEKLQLPRWLLAASPPEGSLEAWLAAAPAGVADLVRGAVRVSSYTNAPGLQSAPAAMRQVALAQKGVRYLDGGWQALVDQLREGLDIRTGVDVDRLPDANVVIVAGPPALARRFGVPVPELVPVRAACLDLVLEALPRPEARFVLGLDAPWYLSEHGSVAQLGGTVVHAARYLAPGESGADALPGLEALLDQAQPGWRALVRFRRFLPELVVTHRIDQPGQTVPGAHRIEGREVHLVGDWVGEEGMIADRAFASAEAAANAVLARRRAAA